MNKSSVPSLQPLGPEFWKRKLAAYLHDPPSKALEIRRHRDRANAAFRQAGIVDEGEAGCYEKRADHLAAAADRLPFPHYSSGLTSAFDGCRNTFRHPLSGGRLLFYQELKSVEQAFEGESSIQPVITSGPDQPVDLWRARFFAHWRLWQSHAAQRDQRLTFLPADTRIPDHTIWSHMQVVSAFDGCVDEENNVSPSFLKFQLGPVQDFIAAAKSIRDLWSGSYLLSWLMAAGLKKLSELAGPDAVIFPNLVNQPLFDLHWKRELWSEVCIGEKPVWESFGWSNRDLLTPNLPNVFLALVPAEQAAAYAEAVEHEIQEEWKQIAAAVYKMAGKAGLTADEEGITTEDRKIKFDHQIEKFLSLSWQVTPWPKTLDDAVGLAAEFDDEMPIREAERRIREVIRTATKSMPVDDRDGRFYEGGEEGKKASPAKLNNVGLGWSVLAAFNSWQLDAVRQVREFEGNSVGSWQVGTFRNKDHLNGRDEAVAGGREWHRRASERDELKSLFKKPDWLGAATLVKRLWHRAYLSQPPWNLNFGRDPHTGFPMPDTRGVSNHHPEQDDSENLDVEDAPEENSYFAVLALDGDEIGKWISGEKTPRFDTQLSDYQDSSKTQSYGAKTYFENKIPSLITTQRPLSPGYHLQFSEALGNFALKIARRVVEDYDGRLIYAGGDDVLALLPADTVLTCAWALRLAFQGKEVPGYAQESVLFEVPEGSDEGFLQFPAFGQRKDELLSDNLGHPIPFLVPGPNADCSAGIAIAHFKSPLQDVVRAAQAAEKRAKNKKNLNRAAVAVSLFKRSGEIIEWGCKWESHALELTQHLLQAMKARKLSAKFPHRLCELLTPYLQRRAGLLEEQNDKGRAGLPGEEKDAFTLEEAKQIIEREVRYALQQHGENYDPTPLLDVYLQTLAKRESMTPSLMIESVIGLAETVAFAHRTQDAPLPSDPHAHAPA